MLGLLNFAFDCNRYVHTEVDYFAEWSIWSTKLNDYGIKKQVMIESRKRQIKFKEEKSFWRKQKIVSWMEIVKKENERWLDKDELLLKVNRKVMAR